MRSSSDCCGGVTRRWWRSHYITSAIYWACWIIRASRIMIMSIENVLFLKNQSCFNQDVFESRAAARILEMLKSWVQFPQVLQAWLNFHVFTLYLTFYVNFISLLYMVLQGWFCRWTRKLASPWVPSTKCQWDFSIRFGIIAENKLCGKQMFMILPHFVQQDNFHKRMWFLKLECNHQK